MAQARGYLAQCMIDFETTFNTDPVAAAGKIMPFNTCNLKGDLQTSAPATITNRRDPVEVVDGNSPVDGSIVVPVDYTSFGYWLRAMYGAPDSVTGAGPYVHTFKTGNAPPSFLMQRRFKDASSVITYLKHGGIKIGKWSLGVSAEGGELVSTLDLAAASESISGTVYDASATTPGLNRLNQKPCTVTEGGSGLTGSVKALDFMVDMGLDTDQYVVDDAGARGDIPEGLMNLSGNVTTLFKDTTLLTKAINRTDSSISFEWTSGSYGLKVIFNEIKYGKSVPMNDGPKGVELSLPFYPFYGNHAGDAAVIVELTSDVADFTA